MSIRYGMGRFLQYVLAALSVAFWCTASVAASFDCEKATVRLERTICSDAALNQADEEMAKLYAQLMETTSPEKLNSALKGQRDWLRQRVASCSDTDAACLTKVYNERIVVLRSIVDNIVPFKLNDRSLLQGIRAACNFNDIKLPPNLNVYAAAQKAGRQLDMQIDQSGYQATQFDVTVNSPIKPVALILSAYEPSIWNIEWTEGTKILAVVATGYHRQAVAGLPESTPTLIATNDNKSHCGWVYFNEKTLNDVNPFSKKMFGKAVEMFHYANNGKAVIGSADLGNAKLLTSQDTPVSRFIDKTRPRAGQAGIRDAVSQGILRPATMADADAWGARKAKLKNNDSLPFVAGAVDRQPFRGPFGSNVYVILKPFKFPAGLDADYLPKFYLADGVPRPEGDYRYVTLFNFNDMTCEGVLC